VGAQTSYVDAKLQALRDAMTECDDVVLLGSGFGGLTIGTSSFSVLGDEFPGRVFQPPISELAVAGVCIGAAVQGMRPVMGVQTSSFMFQGFAQVVNEAPIVHYGTGGGTSAPVVFHMLGGIRTAGGPQHSHRLQAMFWNTPGLEIALPSSPQDVYELLRFAILESDNPTCFIDHPLLLGTVGLLDTDLKPLPFGRGRRVREGTDVTVVATSIMVSRALEAADLLAAEGISVEVIDPRTLVPFDDGLVLDSVARTGRLVVADECHRSCGVAAEVIARVVEAGFSHLRGAPQRVTAPDLPVPFSAELEHEVIPSTAGILSAVRRVVAA